MSYDKQTWTSGEVITATKLNHMEDGIAGAGGGTSGLVTDTSGTLDKTWNEIGAMVSAGALPYLYGSVNGGYIIPLVYYDTDGYEYFAMFSYYDLDGESWVTQSYTSSTADGTLVLDTEPL